MATTYCPECDALINVRNPRLGASIRCSECDADLEVISLYPLEVSFRFDYDDDDYDDDYDRDWEDDNPRQ